MAESKALMVSNVTSVGTANGGEILTMGVQFADGTELTLAFPARMGQGLLSGIISAISMSHRDQLKRLESEQAVADAFGVSPFTPTDFEIGHLKQGGELSVLLRLKKDRIPLIDVHLTREGSQAMAEDLMAHVTTTPAPRVRQ